MEIKKFNPSIAHLESLVAKYKGLEIKNTDDKIGYSAVDIARKDLQNQRVLVTKTGKAMRAEAVKVQKEVIKLEKEAIAIIEPLEKELALKQVRIDNIKELPERIEKLKDINVIPDKEMLEGMDNRSFTNYYKKEREDYFDELQRKEQEKKRKEEDIQRIKEAEERGKKEAEEEIKQENEGRKKADEKLESDDIYQKFLLGNNFDEKTDIIQQEGLEIRLYRIVNTLKL